MVFGAAPVDDWDALGDGAEPVSTNQAGLTAIDLDGAAVSVAYAGLAELETPGFGRGTLLAKRLDGTETLQAGVASGAPGLRAVDGAVARTFQVHRQVARAPRSIRCAICVATTVFAQGP